MPADKEKNQNKINSEREKGAAPPAYMPSIFGWMTMKDQEEHAREIVDFVNEIDNNINNAEDNNGSNKKELFDKSNKNKNI